MTPTVVLYHGNCPDGMTAAWAAWKRKGDGARYLPVNYGEPMPDIADGADVYILDFSYPRETLLALSRRCKVLVLDHHKTAQADLEGLDFAVFDMDHSGATLAWSYFHLFDPSDSDPPKIVLYAEDRDLWRFALPKSREASQYLRQFPYTLAAWEQAAQKFESTFEEIAEVGGHLLAFQDSQVKVMTAPDRVRWIELGGRHVPTCNATVFFSEVGEALCLAHPDAPFAGYYFDRGDVRQWGLRSRGDFDCSAVAKLYGGGGHPGAAGWTEPAPRAKA